LAWDGLSRYFLVRASAGLLIFDSMFHLSRRALVVISGLSVLLAISGWLAAWSKSRAVDDLLHARAAGPSKPSKVGNRRAEGAAEVPLLRDPRSIRLLALMAEMGETPVPGQPNPKFLKAVSLTLNDSSFHRRKRDFSVLLDKMTKHDAPAIHQTFLEFERAGRPFAEEYADFAARWGAIDGAGAMSYFTARQPFDIKPHQLHELMAGWGSTRPEEAMAWIDDHKELLEGLNAYAPVVVGWLQKDPAAATAWLTGGKVSRAEIGVCLTNAVLDKLYSDGIDGMSGWLASLPDDHPDLAAAARQGWNANQYRFQNLDPEQAAIAWGQVGDQSWMGPQEFLHFCMSVQRGNDGDLSAFVEALAQKWPEEGVSSQFDRWMAQDPATVDMALRLMPPSDLREAALQGAVARLERDHPDRVAAFRESQER
jgi:hypothetical protein